MNTSKGCRTGNIQYQTVMQANEAADKIYRRDQKKGRATAYPCDDCGTYHLSRFKENATAARQTKNYKQKRKEHVETN